MVVDCFGFSLMCVLLSPYHGLGNIKAKHLTRWVKVVEVCDGFKATREQKQRDQRDGRRAASGSRRVIVVAKPCTSGELSSRQHGEEHAETKKSYIWSISSIHFCCCK